MKTFRVWIRQFDGDNTAFGDLADDIKDDRNFPKINDYDEILSYLKRKNACSACIDTVKTAWMQYGEVNEP